uniref:NADH-ubiquinone oxidoreductase chain 4 n=1 Tax=Platypus contaminatus TaxID=2066526 RepID=A0A6C0RUD0_9CUCU|nr:NADH dehydrogenase subunit 4 [Platypus contaminatus]QIA44536.1 NADH dehydrogenase subunit 4 [Platypus contaminatus]
MSFMFILVCLLYYYSISVTYYFSSVSYFCGVDFLSYSLILLSFWILFLMILASEKLYSESNFSFFFMFLIIILMISLYLVFSSMSMFIFYLFFEVSMIPTFILVIGWGYQPERISAGIYLFFYTMLMSMPMMLGIFYLKNKFYSMSFYFLSSFNYYVLFFIISMVFFVKMPLFFVHLWLPKAHVEAPISGSMLLAGIMLKLGGYGLMRFLKVFYCYSMNLNFYMICFSLIGSCLVSLICMRQSDIKSLIAYSSVSHMSLVACGILSMKMWGFFGALVLMLGHGLCSSALFCLSNFVYERTGSRSMFINKGMLNIIPSMSIWWFLFCVANMAAPPSMNLLGEIYLLGSVVSFSLYFMVFLMVISFFSAVYSLILFSWVQHGIYYSGIYSFSFMNAREYILMILHFFPLNFLFLKMSFFVL